MTERNERLTEKRREKPKTPKPYAKVMHPLFLPSPFSSYFEGKYGIKDVCLSLPVVLGRKSIIKKINTIGISPKKKLLQKSAKKV